VRIPRPALSTLEPGRGDKNTSPRTSRQERTIRPFPTTVHPVQASDPVSCQNDPFLNLPIQNLRLLRSIEKLDPKQAQASRESLRPFTAGQPSVAQGFVPGAIAAPPNPPSLGKGLPSGSDPISSSSEDSSTRPEAVVSSRHRLSFLPVPAKHLRCSNGCLFCPLLYMPV